MLIENAKRFADPVTGKLELEAILDGLLIDGLIDESNSALLRSISRPDVGRQAVSPLERIAASGWTSARDDQQKIDLDYLTRWLSKKVDLPWKRIDPLQIDVPAVTSVTSHAYSSRFNIICIEVHADHVVFGTAEPFYVEWQTELQRALNKEIHLVICNPTDIKRYLQELYSVSRSVLGARNDQRNQSSAV